MKDTERKIFFRPVDGWVGDVIPYYWRGEFWLFYLHATRVGGFDSGMSWYAVRTRDFVEFEEVGEVLPQGSPSDDDWNCYTGSVVFAEGQHHLFYTAFNPKRVDPELEVAPQLVRHAVSDDLVNWRKLPDVVRAPEHYDAKEFRDPFVYGPSPAGEYSMLIATRQQAGPERRRGVIARAVSQDLFDWRFVDPLMAGRFFMHECPDLFRWGSFWYLVFSEFPERFDTRYRYSTRPEGPWLAAAEDALDGRGLYAAKTASDGARRYLFGWVPTKQGLRDDGQWEWAGDLVVHELVQRADGTLATTTPDQIRHSLNQPVELKQGRPEIGAWSELDGGWQADAGDAMAQLDLGPVPHTCRLSLDVEFDETVSECGVILNSVHDPETGYYLRIEPRRGRVVLDAWRQTNRKPHGWQAGGAANHSISAERSIHLATGTRHRIEILVDGSIGVAYVGDQTALSFRMYDGTGGSLGLFVADGSATFSDLQLSTKTPRRRVHNEPHARTSIAS